MRSPKVVLDNLTNKSIVEGYKYERLYRNLYNPEFYLMAYGNIYHKEGNMTKGVDGNTIDGFNMKMIEKLIESMKEQSYQPYPVRRVYIDKKNKKGKRPLGIPSFYDKLVQEVVRLILESMYENTFSEHSHGFRPKRSCHTALNEIQKTFTGTKWFIEGDIKGFFDNIDHHIIINILKKRIDDEKFINLIWKFLRAGYMEDWIFNNSFSGTPQGGIISPILSNIYLNEFDKFMEKFILSFDKGKKKKINPEYNRIMKQIRKRRKWLNDGLIMEEKGMKYSTKYVEGEFKEELIHEIKELEKQLLQTNYSDPMDESYRRIKYVRYADDFIVGIIGSKTNALNIKNEIKSFLDKELKIELSTDKTLITNSKKFAEFLGYNIGVTRNTTPKADKSGVIKRYNDSKVVLYLPHDKWKNKLLELKALKIVIRDGKEHWKPIHRPYLKDCDDLEILTTYNAEIRGLYNFYKMASNVSVLNKFKYVMEYSMYKTFANKYKSSVSKIITKYRIDKDFGIRYTTKQGNKIAVLYNKGFTRSVKISSDSTIDTMVNTNIYVSKTGLLDRLNAEQCEFCGKKDSEFEVHHVRKLKDLKGKKTWEKFMISRKRKTLVLCRGCHVDLHAGRLD